MVRIFRFGITDKIGKLLCACGKHKYRCEWYDVNLFAFSFSISTAVRVCVRKGCHYPHPITVYLAESKNKNIIVYKKALIMHIRKYGLVDEIIEVTMLPRYFPFLKQPLKLAMSYEDGLNVWRNNELRLIVVTEKLTDFREEFMERTEGFISTFRLDESRLHESLIENNSLWKEYLTAEYIDNYLDGEKT